MFERQLKLGMGKIGFGSSSDQLDRASGWIKIIRIQLKSIT